MKRMIGISVAAACAMGMSAAFAQSVQRGDATVGSAAKPAPILVAQAGGAAAGATAGGATAGVGIATTVVLVTATIAAVAVTADSGTAGTVSH